MRPPIPETTTLKLEQIKIFLRRWFSFSNALNSVNFARPMPP